MDHKARADWELTFWDAKDNILKTEIITNRTELEASKEAEAEADIFSQLNEYDTWTLRKVKNHE